MIGFPTKQDEEPRKVKAFFLVAEDSVVPPPSAKRRPSAGRNVSNRLLEIRIGNKKAKCEVMGDQAWRAEFF